MVQICIEVNRGLSRENWDSIEPFAIELLGKENRCCVCGKQKVTPFVRIHGLDVREARIAVGLFHCPEHSGYYEINDYTLVNGLMILTKPIWKPIGKWFNIPWWEFKKIVYSRTPFAEAFPMYELNRAFVGVGNLCLKTIEIERIPDSYVIEKPENKSVPQEDGDSLRKQVGENLHSGKRETNTSENKYHHDFMVPVEVYLDNEYYEKLNNARTLQEAEEIVRDYYKKHPKEENTTKEAPAKGQQAIKKKKHWWNKS